MTLATLAITLAIILMAYFIRGITGFGSGLIAVPLLAHFLPLQFVVPLCLMLDFSASLVLSRHGRRQVRWNEIRPLLPFTVVGIVAGAVLLLKLPREPLLTSLGLFVMLFGLRYVFNIHGDRIVSRLWAMPAGLLGGMIGALFGTGGPPYVIYLTHRLRDKSELRATFSGLFLLEGALRILTFIAAGLLLQAQLLTTILLAAPFMAAGLYLGNKVHIGISSRQLILLIGLLLVISGGSLLWRAWA
jgi:uncharacterized membrane protein YfcA